MLAPSRRSTRSRSEASILTRTLIGKKAFVRLTEDNSAAELATKLGLV